MSTVDISLANILLTVCQILFNKRSKCLTLFVIFIPETRSEMFTVIRYMWCVWCLLWCQSLRLCIRLSLSICFDTFCVSPPSRMGQQVSRRLAVSCFSLLSCRPISCWVTSVPPTHTPFNSIMTLMLHFIQLRESYVKSCSVFEPSAFSSVLSFVFVCV